MAVTQIFKSHLKDKKDLTYVINVLQERVSTDSGPRRPIWLAVSEKGVSVLEKSPAMKVLHFYSYREISTFGGSNGDDSFMLVISSQGSPNAGQKAKQRSQGNVVEKLVFGMPNLKV